jgi:hypothetical protein
MPNFVFAYHGSTRPQNPAQHMARWKAWVTGLGDALVNPGVPVGKSKTVSADGVSEGGGSSPLSGFSIVQAESMDAAIALTRGCPHLDIGTIEVAEAMQMRMGPD